jgi:hypothetical protein
MKSSLDRLVYCVAGVLTAALLSAGCSSGEGPVSAGSVRILNALATDFDSVEVYDAKGARVHGGYFSCPAGQACILTLPVAPDTQALGYRFLDRSGRMVGASPAALATNTGYTVRVDSDTTGLDLFTRLVDAGRYSAITVTHLIDAHIYKEYAAGERPSLLTDLTRHYQRALSDPAYSEAQYQADVLKAMGAAIANGGSVSLEAARLPQPARGAVLGSTALKAATSGSSSAGSGTPAPPCPSTFNNLQGIVGGVLQVALKTSNPIFVDSVRLTSQLFGGACSSANTGAMLKAISDKLDEIQSTLNTMSTQLSTIGIQLDLIATQIADATLQASYSGFNSDQLKVDKIVKTYQGLLRPHGGANYSLKQFDNLNAYLTSLSGGFNQTSYSSSSVLRSLMGDLQSHLDTYSRLLDPQRAMEIRDSVNTLCQNSESIVGDIISRRNQCNAILLALLGTSAASAQRLALVMDDIIQAIDAQFAAASADAAKTQWLGGNFVNNLYPEKTWLEASSQLKTDMLSSLDLFASIIKPAFISPTEGLPTVLMTNLVKAGCDKSVGGNSLAAVEGWVIKETTGPASPDRYITVQCKGRGDELVYSRLFYERDTGTYTNGDRYKLSNVLGAIYKGGLKEPTIDDEYGKDSGILAKTTLDNNSSDWHFWLAAPGLTQIGDGKGRIQPTRLRQTRSHTLPLGWQTLTDAPDQFKCGDVPGVSCNSFNTTSGFREVTAVDGYTDFQGTTIATPVQSIEDSGRVATYTDTPVQHYWTDVSPKMGAFGGRGVIQFAYLTYTWVTDLDGWLGKPDPRYTRTVLFRVGIFQWVADNGFARDVRFSCVSADCTKKKDTAADFRTLIFEGGPRISWTPPSGEKFTYHLLINDLSTMESR